MLTAGGVFMLRLVCIVDMVKQEQEETPRPLKRV